MLRDSLKDVLDQERPSERFRFGLERASDDLQHLLKISDRLDELWRESRSFQLQEAAYALLSEGFALYARGRLIPAAVIAREVVTASSKLEDAMLIVRSLMLCGDSARIQGRFRQAERHYRRTLRALKRAQFPSVGNDISLLALRLMACGMNTFDLIQIGDWFPLYWSGEEWATARARSWMLEFYGDYLMEVDNSLQGWKKVDESIKIAGDIGPEERVLRLIGAAAMAHRKNATDKALVFLDQADSHLIAIKDVSTVHHETRVRLVRAEVLWGMGRLQESLESCRESLRLLRTSATTKKLVPDALTLASLVAGQLGSFDLAEALAVLARHERGELERQGIGTSNRRLLPAVAASLQDDRDAQLQDPTHLKKTASRVQAWLEGDSILLKRSEHRLTRPLHPAADATSEGQSVMPPDL